MLKALLGDTHKAVDMDSPLALTGTIFLGVVGAAVFLVQPGYVQGLVEARGFTDSEAGYLASADMVGMAITTIYVSFRMGHIKWRPFMVIALAAMTVGNLLSVVLTGFWPLLITRLAVGLGEGGVVPLTFAAIALTRHQDRNFGLYISGCLTYAAFTLVAMPQAIDLWGMEGIFLFFALLSAAGLAFVKYMPVAGHEDYHGSGTGHISPLLIALALAAMLSYFLAQGIAWAYLFLIGISGGLSEQAVGNGLMISQFLGIAGALTTTAVAGRFGRALPLGLGIAAGIASLAVLFGEMSFLVYAAAVGVFNYAWNMVHPYLLASMASFDDTGKVVVWAVVMQTVGLGIGPSIGASVISPGVYDNVNWSAMGFFLLSLACILPPLFASGGYRFNLAKA